MIGRYQALAKSIQDELVELGETVAAVSRHWHGVQSAAMDQAPSTRGNGRTIYAPHSDGCFRLW